MLCALCASCNHSSPYTYAYGLGPNGTGSDVLLTYNSQPDYWPTLTGDSTGILYAFVSVEAGANPHHRCIGVMPVGGGQRYWQWCDDAATRTDSLGSFPAYAMAADGRLIYVETSVAVRFPFAPPDTRLWLADSAFPYRRRSLLTFPVTVGDSTVNWLADLTWTGSHTFLALAERMVPLGHCICSLFDSVFYGESVVRGTIDSNGATLAPIPGTIGATGYSQAENGTSIVFTRLNSADLLRVPAVGGSPVVAAMTTSRPGVQVLGVSCRSDSCVVAVGPARTAADGGPSIGSPFELRRVSLATGDTTLLLTRGGGALMNPQLTPSGTIVAGFGQMMGHLQSYSSPAVDLHLYSVPP